MGKLALYPLLFLIICGIQISTSKISSKKGPAVRETIEINGKRYQIFVGEISLEGGKEECEYYNQKIVSFDEEGEYMGILRGIMNLGYANHWFWSGGQRDANSDTWYWTVSGKNFTSTYWIPGNPADPRNVTSCMSFNIQSGGWDDDLCDNNFGLGIVCE